MKVTRRDLFTIAAIAVVLVVLIMSTVHEKAKPVPFDDKHLAFYEAMKKGLDRIEAERGCVPCHNSGAIPLPKKHPPKEQCLICHKLNYPDLRHQKKGSRWAPFSVSSFKFCGLF